MTQLLNSPETRSLNKSRENQTRCGFTITLCLGSAQTVVKPCQSLSSGKAVGLGTESLQPAGYQAVLTESVPPVTTDRGELSWVMREWWGTLGKARTAQLGCGALKFTPKGYV